MFGFRNSKRRRPDGTATREVASKAPERPAGADGPLPGDAHEAVGRAHEVIRAQLADLSHRHQALRQTGETLESLERSVMQLLSEHQRTRTMVDGARGELEAEREQHGRLRQEYGVLQQEMHALRHSRLHTESALDSTHSQLQEATGEVSVLRQELSSAQADLTKLRNDHAEAETRAAEADERATFYRTRFEEHQVEVSTLQAAVQKEAQQAAVLADELTTLRAGMEKLNGDLARLDRERGETRRQLEEAEAARKELEAALAEAERRHKAAEQGQNETLEQARASIGNLRNRMDALVSRLQVTEGLLAKAREEVSTRTEECSAAQREILQLNLEKNGLEKRLEEHRRERERVERLARETSEINARLAERSHGLVSNLKNRDREYEATKQKFIAASAELNHAREQLRSTEQQYQTHIAELNAQVSHERSSRQMSEGALEAARATIDQLRLELARFRPSAAEAQHPGDVQAKLSPSLPKAALLVDDPPPATARGSVKRPAADAGPRPHLNGSGRNGVPAPTVVVQAAEVDGGGSGAN